MKQYNALDQETRKRDVNAWRSVVSTVIIAISEFEDAVFTENIPMFYDEISNLIVGDLTAEMRNTIRAILVRVGLLFKIVTQKDKIESQLHVDTEIEVEINIDRLENMEGTSSPLLDEDRFMNPIET